MENDMITQDQIIDVKWFCAKDNIGIVLVNLPYGYKAYIGVCAGLDEKYDMLDIAQNGTRFNYGDKLWPGLKWAI